MAKFYAELRYNDRWCPNTFGQIPHHGRYGNNGEMRIMRLSGPGAELRILGKNDEGMPVYFLEINVGHEKLSLDQLRHVYSPDGKFRAPAPRPVIEDDGFETVVGLE